MRGRRLRREDNGQEAFGDERAAGREADGMGARSADIEGQAVPLHSLSSRGAVQSTFGHPGPIVPTAHTETRSAVRVHQVDGLVKDAPFIFEGELYLEVRRDIAEDGDGGNGQFIEQADEHDLPGAVGLIAHRKRAGVSCPSRQG